MSNRAIRRAQQRWTEHNAGMHGVATPSDDIVGDPFAVFVTALCDNHSQPWEQIAMIVTHQRVNEDKVLDMIRYLKAQDAVNTCEQCHRPITRWSADNTRISTFEQAHPNWKPVPGT